MSIRIAARAALAALVFASAARAQQPAPAPEPIQLAQTFLLAWGHERWDELRAVAGEQVTIRVGGKTYTLQPGAASEVTLVFPFSGISTARVNGEVKGVAIEALAVKAGENEVRGSGTLTYQEKDGAFKVIGVSIGK
jgi:hypothetical protein